MNELQAARESIAELIESMASNGPPEPLHSYLRAEVDRWRRVASEVSGTVWDKTIRALYFDQYGAIVAIDTPNGIFVNGEPAEAIGRRELCSVEHARYLDGCAAWAEWELARYLAGKDRRNAPEPPDHGEHSITDITYPPEVRDGIKRARDLAREWAQKRGEI